MISPSCTAIENIPDSLLEQCARYVVQHLDTISIADPITKELKLKEGISLPSEICEKLVEVYQQLGNSFDDKFVKIFENPEATRLKRIRLRNSSINDDSFCLLLNHNLLELDLANCRTLTGSSLDHIIEKGKSLISLSFGSSVHLLPGSLISDFKKKGVSGYEKRGYILKAPNLRKLTVRKVYIPDEKMYFPLLLKPLVKLTHLDLSGCYDLGDLSYLEDLPYLVSLTLYNVQRLQKSAAIASIRKLTGLKHLDISQLDEKPGTFKNPSETLASLVESLPNLISLDISGTNLAGRGVAEHPSKKEHEFPQSDIPGLRSRAGNPFEFLGLYGTQHDACRRPNIPAKRVSGDANEEQTLNAAHAYIDRPDLLQKVLNDLFHLFRFETCSNVDVALKLVLEAMDRHLNEKHIQISGSASLYYIARCRERRPYGMKVRRHIISTLLNGLCAFQDDETMIRNSCLTLCQFKIPHDVLFDYERLVHILLFIVEETEHESFVQRIGIYLLNSVACQIDGTHRQFLGDLDVIGKMLSLINNRIERRVCDDVLEVAWSTMWNVTDETALNCERFLKGHGMELFIGCLNTFPNKEELLRNMMGLLGNVAEVKSLRPCLMTDRFVSVFADLLDSFTDGIEVSYNAAGVLAHMCSDGPEAWTIEEPDRETVLSKMIGAIDRWDLETERNINYRSFEPILRLLKVTHTPECQHWAAWALANLTKVYPNKYCSLIENEGGIALLENVLQSKFSYPRIKELVTIVIRNCRRFREKNYYTPEVLLEG